jgi:fatty acid desaturase
MNITGPGRTVIQTESTSTSALRQLLRRELSSEAFRRSPERIIVAVAITAAIAATSFLLAFQLAPPLLGPLLSVICGGLYASLFFLGHEAGHGSILKSRSGRHVLMGIAFAVFLLSPTLWLTWHNRVHHSHANSSYRDPDNFGDDETHLYGAPRRTLPGALHRMLIRTVLALTPGQGKWFTLFYMPVWFTIHAQVVLWLKSREGGGFASLDRPQAISETCLMAALWISLGFHLDAWRVMLVILMPMAVANTIIMSYIMTNHLLRPLSEDPDPLTTSLSVRTHPVLDLMHFKFSHHVEHHLFPSMSSKYVGRVRAKLQQHAGDRYLAPPHLSAILLVFHTPRLHDQVGDLYDPTSGRRIRAEQMNRTLLVLMRNSTARRSWEDLDEPA